MDGSKIKHSWELGLGLQRKSVRQTDKMEVKVGTYTDRLAGGSRWIDMICS